MMPPLVAIIIAIGLVGSAFLAFVVAYGWVSLRERVYDDAENHDPFYRYDGQQDFGNAFSLSFVCGGLVTTVVAVALC